MTRYLLDTNVISDATKPSPSEALLSWLSGRLDEELFVSALSLAEIRRGILEKSEGRKRRDLEARFSGPEGPLALFAGRILPFDARAALAWAELMAAGRAAGQPRSAIDTMVAAVARVNDCVIVTDNEKHFGGLPALNPKRVRT